ncbi:hypothetical protein AYO21_10405 [Fonsecaea monophora]|uniref:DNA-binding protein RAP1 n=1 Tax=Fonsecaea monophora TaxID=254056 RepID=A0A177ETN3_9EURO|nr:hypothetical protein AYO21_10405 [Fonsecaea monophora]KAH0843900.1 hypothetical protein FOPE_08469 [Fonsecaea pedrosoi]OAG35395.1 hypothetical protein AYO21_10405 [Fonsecaea monophora]
MSGHVVHHGVPRTHNDDSDRESHATLFAGQKLWFSHAIPQRQQMIQKAQLNGAVVVSRDTEADVRLVDHLRKNNAPGTYSYRYVELSLRNGQLENLADHAVGAPSRVSRPVGSTITAPKSGRTPFTAEDDQFLWDWMKPFIDRGGAWKGNEIYKQMEEANPRHTYQSWRDRWIKHTQFHKRQVRETVAPERPRMDAPETRLSHSVHKRRHRPELPDDGGSARAKPGVDPSQCVTAVSGRVGDRLPNIAAPQGEVSLTVPTTPRSPEVVADTHHDVSQTQSSTNPQSMIRTSFNIEEYDELYELAATFEGGQFIDFDTPWEELARQRGTHTPAEWKHFFISRIIPDYCKAKNLTVSEVAPYLEGEPDEHTTNTVELLDSREKVEATSVTSETQDDGECANCFTTKTVRWRHDKEGKLICDECAKFVRRHGYHRPSTALSVDDAAMNKDEDEQPEIHARKRRITDGRTNSAANTNLPQNTSRVGSTGPPAPVRGDYSQQVPSDTPPSFQLETSLTSRPPGPNESRKRRAGKGSQSQSTQESSQSGTQSQAVDDSLRQESHNQTLRSKGLTADMQDFQSKESDTHAQPSTVSENDPSREGATAFLVSPGGKRKPTQDELGDISYWQHSSIRIQNTIRSSSRSLAVTDSQWDDALLHPMASSNPPKRARTFRDYSPVSATESDNDDEMRKHYRRSKSGLAADFSGSATLLRDQASEQFETAQESIPEYETGPEEPLQSHGQRKTPLALSNRLEDIKAELDIAIEHPESSDRIDAVSDSISDVAHEENTRENVTRLTEIDESDHSQDSLKVQRRLSDHSFLEPPPILSYPALGNPQASPGAADKPSSSEDASGKRGEVEEEQIEQEDTREDSSPEPDGHETDEWMALQQTLHSSVPDLEPVLFKALESTSFDFGLASEVVEIMLTNRRRVLEKQRGRGLKSGTGRLTELAEANLDMESLLPQAMRGVWTETDDSLLLSPDANDMNTVLRKHGRNVCDLRFEFLRHFVEE